MPVAPQYLSVKSNDGLTVYAVFRRVSDLEYLNTFTAAFESFTAGHWYGSGTNNYSVAATKTVQSANIAADYSVLIPSMLAGVYFAEWYIQQGATPAVTDGSPAWVTQNILWNGTTLLPAINSGGNAYADIPANGINATQSFNNTGQTTAIPATFLPAAAGTAPNSPVPAFDGVGLEFPINYPVSQPFTISGLDSTGWTQFVFTVKATSGAADSAALVTVVVSNPGVGTDGLILLNGAAPSGSTSNADGTITVNGITTNTSLTLTLTARGHALTAGNSYVWELTRYSGGSGTKYMIGQGNWAALQSVRANPVAS